MTCRGVRLSSAAIIYTTCMVSNVMCAAAGGAVRNVSGSESDSFTQSSPSTFLSTAKALSSVSTAPAAITTIAVSGSCAPCSCWNTTRGVTMECSFQSDNPESLIEAIKRAEKSDISSLVISSVSILPQDLHLAKILPKVNVLVFANLSWTRIPDIRGLNNLIELFAYRCSLDEVPSALSMGDSASSLVIVSLAGNNLDQIPELAFDGHYKLEKLILSKNRIGNIHPRAFESLASLKVLDLSNNKLISIPECLKPLKQLRELILTDNQITYIGERVFSTFAHLVVLELANNPLDSFHRNAFAGIPKLKRLMLKQVPNLEYFPNFNGTDSLEQLRLSRARLSSLPPNLCEILPKLKILYLMSNNLSSIPNLENCRDLLILDLTYNRISSIPSNAFASLESLRDLNLGNNLVAEINKDTFIGLRKLQVLALEKNKISYIHSDALLPLTALEDLNLAENRFPQLPHAGLTNLRRIAVSNNPNLRDFPPPESFPRITRLYLSYSYHCCAYTEPSEESMLGAGLRLNTFKEEKKTHVPETPDTILWLKEGFGEKVDFGEWNRSHEIGHLEGNSSERFPEFARALFKVFGPDYIIPDNLAQYAEEYLEDYKTTVESSDSHRIPITCLPAPTPFMPCEDLFGWWTLRCGIWVVFLLALLGNGLVVVVLSFGRSKIDVPRFLVCNLAMADFLMGIYLGFLAVVDASTLNEFKFYGVAWQTSFGCQLAGFLGVLSSELSVYTLAVITMERNYAITHAMHLNKRLSLKHATYIMSIGWSFALIMAIMPLFGISDYRKFAVCLPFETGNQASMTYVVSLIAVNGVAFLILMGCYLKMYCAIRGSQAWNSNDSRIAKRMALLVFTDFLCWAPIAFFSLTAVSGMQLINLEEAKVFTIFVLPLNSCANPFLYAIFTKQFKRDCVLICKRIEESRVTRGIGRCRHSSNFSNRHTLVNTNSAGERKSISNEHHCQCQCGMIKSITREHLISSEGGWKKFARKYLLCQEIESETEYNAYNMALVRIQRNLERGANRTSSISSENFSSRSDSWRQGSIPLRLLDRVNGQRKGSWLVTRKASQDSSISCSRQDSSTSTVRVTSRSSVSSGETNQLLRNLHFGHGHGHSHGSVPPIHRGGAEGGPLGRGAATQVPKPLDPTLQRLYRAPLQTNKPQLCRQLAMDDGFRNFPSGLPSNSGCQQQTGRSTPSDMRRFKGEQLCSVCARKELGLMNPLGTAAARPRSKDDNKFSCYYSRLTETSREDSSDANSKDDQQMTASDQSGSGSGGGGGDHHHHHHTKTKSIIETTNATFDNTNSNSDGDAQGHSIPSTATTGVTSSDGNSYPEPLETSDDNLGEGTTSEASLRDTERQRQTAASRPSNRKRKHYISVDDINAKELHSHPNTKANRKTASDNSLKKLSLRSLPQFLRQLSSQSPRNSTQKIAHTLCNVAPGQHLTLPSSGLPSSKSDTGIAQNEEWGGCLQPHTEQETSSDSESDHSEIRFVAAPSIAIQTSPQLADNEEGDDLAEHSPLIE